MAVLRRGGLLPHADISPADMRAPRDLLRWRMPCMRTWAERLAHVHNTNSQDNLPELGTKMAYKAKRDGGAERLPEPAVPKSIAVDLALSGHDDPRRRDVEWSILQAAKQDDAHTLSWLRTVPGIGEILSLVLLYADP